jgi:hypothetical protein
MAYANLDLVYNSIVSHIYCLTVVYSAAAVKVFNEKRR